MSVSKILTNVYIILLIFLFSNVGAQNMDSLRHTALQPWQESLESILNQVNIRFNSSVKIDQVEFAEFKTKYAIEFMNEWMAIGKAVEKDSINIFNADGYINYEVTRYIDLYHQFRNAHIAAPAIGNKNNLPNPLLVDDDTIRPDPGICQPACTNIDFETGNLNGWKSCGALNQGWAPNQLYPGSPQLFGYSNPIQYAGTPPPGYSKWADCYGPTGNFTGVSKGPYGSKNWQVKMTSGSGIDCASKGTSVQVPVVCPAALGGGNYSVMLGDFDSVFCGIGLIEQKFMVTTSNAAFTYMYAALMENPSHPYWDQPYFRVSFFDQNGDTIPGCGNYLVVADSNANGFTYVKNWQPCHPSQTPVLIKPWSCVFVSLRKYIGQCVTVQFMVADCNETGHAGWAYVDAKCNTLTITATPTGNCSNPTAVLTAPTSCGIASYQWSGPCIIGPSNGQSITVGCDGVYQVILISAAGGGCSDTLTDTVHLASIGGINTDFTYAGSCGVMTFSDTSNIAGATWNWQFPGGTPSSSTSQNPGTIIYSPGTYTATLIVTNAAGCTDTVVHTFTVTSTPMIANFNSSPVCIGTPTNFNDLSTGPPTSWNWNFGNGNTSTQQNPTNTYTVAGTYTVTLIANSGACGGDTISLPVTVNPLPVASFSNTTVCLNNATVFTDASIGNNTISVWSWSFGDGVTSSLQNPSHTYNTAGTYTSTLVVTNNFGCKDSIPLIAIVNPLPVANFGPATACLGNPSCFTDLSAITSGSITGWSWNFGDPASGVNNISNVQNPCHLFSTAGTFSIMLTVTSGSNCQGTTILSVTINPLPTAQFSNTSPCLGSAANLADGSTSVANDPITTWSWSMTGGVPNTASSQNTSTTYNTAGTYNVILIVTTQAGCKDTIDQQVLVHNPPVANISGGGSGCGNVCNQYIDQSTSADGTITNWAWSFPGGSPSSSNFQNPSNICYTTPGTYGASLIVTSSFGCKDTVNIASIITVYSWPKADFCVSLLIAPATDPVFNFCDLWSSDVVQWTWNFGDNDSNTVSTDPTHSYSATATGNDFYNYTVCIRVENQHGCWDTTCKTVELIPEFEFYIPNTFTPNGDNINEMFFGKCRGVKEYNIYIFDRWGNLIWDCHHSGKNTDWDSQGQDGLSSFCQWNGTVEKGGQDMSGHSNMLAQEDVYVWKVALTDIFNKHHDYVGHVNIVR